MPFQKLHLKPKPKPEEEEGSRGTEQAPQMVELMLDNWDQLQQKFADYSESEKEEIIEHFNSTIDALGDSLFGDEANKAEFQDLVENCDEEQQKEFLTCVKEALLIDYE